MAQVVSTSLQWFRSLHQGNGINRKNHYALASVASCSSYYPVRLVTTLQDQPLLLIFQDMSIICRDPTLTRLSTIRPLLLDLGLHPGLRSVEEFGCHGYTPGDGQVTVLGLCALTLQLTESSHYWWVADGG